VQKIPTIFLRDPDALKHVTDQPNPACGWVFDGAGAPTRKYDGTCVLFDGARWWARREVRPGKTPPPNYRPVETDPNTGKTVGWEPVEQSAFAKYHMEALAGDLSVVDGTYELVGPKVNGNPEQVGRHLLVRHGYQTSADDDALTSLVRDFAGFRSWLLAHPTWEGIVFHHPDGRMAKIKRRDFEPARPDCSA